MPTKTQNPQKDLLYIITYLIPLLTGLVVYITTAQGNKRLKFHAVQSIFLGIVIILVSWIGGWIFWWGASLLNFLLWLYGIYVGYQAYGGEDMEMPALGSFARQYSK